MKEGMVVGSCMELAASMCLDDTSRDIFKKILYCLLPRFLGHIALVILGWGENATFKQTVDTAAAQKSQCNPRLH